MPSARSTPISAFQKLLSIDEVNEAAIQESEWVYLEGYLGDLPTGHAAALKTKALAETARRNNRRQLF